MLDGKTVLVVVPARGGSKGVPLKNIRAVGGVPLVGRVGLVIKELAFVDKAVVSTDHEEIARVARTYGIESPFYRSTELSGDRVGDWEVLTDALEKMEALDKTVYDIIIMLQPTSPLRTPKQVADTVKKLIDGEFDAVWTVSETDIKSHPLKQLQVNERGEMQHYDPAGKKIVARQELVPLFHRNGIAYAMTRECLLKKKSIYGDRLGAVIVSEPVANIDTEADIENAEAHLKAL
ncbi:MAG: hypothetical protein DHS20C01_13820 [marine bacterium B5-7]|nr:MAG: hypothetical protein DHS20C01_13820 [marine bacterium B5-7]